ncbi:MAG: geranylgeranylglyceryl/heptaprenylglyceryl phosphate synthase [Crocinitomicaceae bacterium]
MSVKVLDIIKEKTIKKQKAFALLLDPDKCTIESLSILIPKAVACNVDYIFFGGSLLVEDKVDENIEYVKNNCDIPVVLFPGNPNQVTQKADALFFLSLISGRNPEMLIGHHVVAAPFLKQMDIEVIPTGYILIDGGQVTSVSYMSNTTPIPNTKPDIAACTAMAGEMLGLSLMYMDAGSGALHPIPPQIIGAVKKYTNCPVIVGGGIRTKEQAFEACQGGADVIVVGNAIEKDESLMELMAKTVHSFNK